MNNTRPVPICPTQQQPADLARESLHYHADPFNIFDGIDQSPAPESDRESRGRRRDRDSSDGDGRLCLSGFSVSLSSLHSLSDKDFDELVSGTLPESGGAKLLDGCLFRLARRCRGLGDGIEATTFWPVLQRWYGRAKPHVGDADFAEVFGCFASAYNRVRTPEGKGVIDLAWRRACETEPLRAAVELYGKDRPITHLASLCLELQRLGGERGEDTFFISCRSAARLIGVGHDTALRLLHALLANGFITLTTPGTVGAHGRAARYRFIGGTSR